MLIKEVEKEKGRKKKMSPILALALIQLGCPESWRSHVPRLRGLTFLQVSFPCPGNKFHAFYVNQLPHTVHSFRPLWKWYRGLH